MSTNIFSRSSLKTKLTISFVAVVGVATLLSAVVFLVLMIDSYRSATQEKLNETLRVADARVQETARGLEIYTDLIASDMQFGQLLAYDSEMGISSKIEEFVAMSNSELIAFIPNPIQYVEIKDHIFTNSGNENLVSPIRKWIDTTSLLQPFVMDGEKGWIKFADQLYVFAAKPVLHFGTNMGVIFIGRRASNEMAQEIAKVTTTQVLISGSEKLLGHSFDATLLPEDTLSEALLSWIESNDLKLDALDIGKFSYAGFANLIRDNSGQALAKVTLLVSNEKLQEAKNQTLFRGGLIALITALLSGLIGLFLAKKVSNPITEMTGGIERITEQEDLSIRVEEKHSDEVGVLARSFNQLMNRLEVTNRKLAESERRMKEELTMASTVQEMLFPPRIAHFGDLHLASFIEASTETGGDWYGYSEDPKGKRAHIMIGDVTGHGMPAALITAISNGYFKGVESLDDLIEKQFQGAQKHIRELGLSMDRVLHYLNEMLIEITQGKLMMTFFASELDLEQKKLRYANGGHNRPILLRKKENGSFGYTVLKSDPSRRLGENRNVDFIEHEIDIEMGDIVVWYTDGIIECMNENNQQYGKQRFVKSLRQSAHLSPTEIVQQVISQAYEFYGDVPRADDVTLVVGKIESA